MTPVEVPPPSVSPEPKSQLRSGKRESRLFQWICSSVTWMSVVVLLVLLVSVTKNAVGWLDWQFLTSWDSRFPQKAGILSGALGTMWVISFTILISVPIGVGAAVYLEEYAGNGWLTQIIRVNLANLAGVPSIVYGILGLTVFVRMFGLFGPHGVIQKYTGVTIDGLFYSEWLDGYLIPLPFGRVVLSASLTLSLLILPVIIIASQEALRAIPASLRHASLALGATRWQTIRHQVLPAATPGIMTGVILAISRAIGETAPLVMLGAMTFVNFGPGNLDSLSDLRDHPQGLLKAPFDTFTVIPIEIFFWVQKFKPEFKSVAAAGIVVLLVILLLLNGLAILIRNRYSKHLRW
ncbi:phosphate ABC transporter permease PstA [Planctomicrobium sp. SH661]|uniref:phosphate ABC transporter permease PstA n=1 Tax=Planctomicrobium sp. SH661 TaxID=3448124 RepID=UPI003F5B0AAF